MSITQEPPPSRLRVVPEPPVRTSEPVAVIAGGDAHRNCTAMDNSYAVSSALRALGCEPVRIKTGRYLAAELAATGARAAVPAVLDQRLADGVVPDLCAELGIACVGASGPALRSCADKAVARVHMEKWGVAVPAQRLFPQSAVDIGGLGATLPAAVANLGEEVFIKPRFGHGGVGVKKVRGTTAAASAITNAFSYGESVVMERTVVGDEVSVLMTGTAEEPMAVGLAQVTYDSDETLAASWARRYTPAHGLDDRVRRTAVGTARRVARALGLHGVFTVDMVHDNDGTAWVIDADGMLDWRPEGALAACLTSSDVTEPDLLASLLREADATMRRAA